MAKTRLSNKGQIVIPKPIRSAHHWEPGQELTVIDLGDGIALKPVTLFKETTLRDVAGCLKKPGAAPRSLEDMDRAIEEGVKEEIDDLG